MMVLSTLVLVVVLFADGTSIKHTKHLIFVIDLLLNWCMFVTLITMLWPESAKSG